METQDSKQGRPFFGAPRIRLQHGRCNLFLNHHTRLLDGLLFRIYKAIKVTNNQPQVSLLNAQIALTWSHWIFLFQKTEAKPNEYSSLSNSFSNKQILNKQRKDQSNE
jgi:hypothetical protein